MKKIIASALVLALSVGVAQAQVKEQKQRSKKEHRMHGAKELNLTEEQKAKMKVMHQEQRKEMQALDNQALTREQYQAKRKEIHEKYRTQFQSILTPAQKTQIEKSKAERKEKGQYKRNPNAEKRDLNYRRQGMMKGKKDKMAKGMDMQKELNLTSDQQQKMQQIRTDMKTKMQTLRQDQSLSKEEKQARMKELMEDHKAQIKSVLTAEQIKKLESRKKEFKNK